MFIIAEQPSACWCLISRLHSPLWSICNSRKVNSCACNLFTVNWYFDAYIPRCGHELGLSDVHKEAKFLAFFFNPFDQLFQVFFGFWEKSCVVSISKIMFLPPIFTLIFDSSSSGFIMVSSTYRLIRKMKEWNLVHSFLYLEQIRVYISYLPSGFLICVQQFHQLVLTFPGLLGLSKACCDWPGQKLL